ncbi:T9SS type A sorting domain-containing protein [Paracrocinitomix mangrovi]|uniref:endonuclease/exonuclease/phosphatase family protein n=1 Tax=Paracrocinitomix mangrovi TaxID=2862509 RepID=UPI001C8E9C8B|nr:endonuclease/exonuclease/phosphatase family protein [Paracrocinitomix mangrovi]UKN02062.1 T9SS type A sorting domain-containing protein [Paracrocinitomix mangrovi]
MKKLLLSFALLLGASSFAQNTDTVKVMAYNLLNFPQINSARISHLETIFQEALPDILMVCELTSSTGANGILNNSLNVNGITHYQKANYVAGPDTQNMLYYNSNKLGLHEQNEIATALRDINEYVLYYKSDDIATTTDTTFFYVYVAHLKASTGFETERNLEVQEAKDFMATRSGLENVLFGGDFNIYGSSEPAWNTILNGAGVTLVDPINVPGEWHSDWGYADIHTQSTRTATFDGGSTGGMDDRFDFIFMSPDLKSWGNQAKLIDGTYWAYGQDGNHFNGEINGSPTNTSLPTAVIDALYLMSDHLPVYAEIEVQKTFNSVPESTIEINAFYYQDAIHFQTAESLTDIGSMYVFDMSGKKIKEFKPSSQEEKFDVSFLEKGVYILRSEKGNFNLKFVR